MKNNSRQVDIYVIDNSWFFIFPKFNDNIVSAINVVYFLKVGRSISDGSIDFSAQKANKVKLLDISNLT